MNVIPAYFLLACLSQHRMGSTRQLHDLLGSGRHINATRLQLQDLRSQGLADCVVLPRPGSMRLWYLTASGRDVAGSLPELRDQDHPAFTDTPASIKVRAPHTLAVLRTHLAFLADARRHGDDYGPLDWSPEVGHRLSETRGDALIADALMRYTTTDAGSRTQLRAFIELDRATMSSERLASKLMTYSRFHDYTPVAIAARRSGNRTVAPLPAWLRHYPVFPRVLFVLTAASRPVLDNRIQDLRAMAAGNPLAARLARKVPLGAAVLEDLEAHGPSAPIWTPLAGEDTSPWGWTAL
ncbi:replication-relaxation family protein [Streptacidiphilus anmyonensis]|uniref:replication-relaxation family protein n=1 Tax=Streptacidiphilus anmyonensis TaxID=405782 RepID=UPI0005AA7501|nr:replication-relaxation family protein [Streptacidiphilus anmyonensis]